MPLILDNIQNHLLTELSKALQVAHRADFCVGYFNLRGWRQIANHIDRFHGGEGHCCRLLIGMQPAPQEELRRVLSLTQENGAIDQATAIRLKQQLAHEFREQLMLGMPTKEDEEGLRKLAEQIQQQKVVVKLFLRYPLHAKLYLLFREDLLNPTIGYLGSSNLTLAGLCQQGELNIDVLDRDACKKLAEWFEARWNDRFCVDISQELVKIIHESWARPSLIPPYLIYLKMAYHLAEEARAGLTEFRIPSDFENELFDFQKAAVQIAARHLNRRGGVLIGDVVGLGKTLMATALARIFEDDYGYETLIICPKNLVSMWEDYRLRYRLRAKVLSITQVQQKLPRLQRFRLVIIDESHNLRNRDGKRYRVIADYIAANDSRVILLSATPYNKTLLDLSNQLRLFVDEHADLGIRPERLLRAVKEVNFIREHQCPVRSLAAFEKSPFIDDWRDLMRLYMVRRTRSFIQQNYAKHDPQRNRKYLEFPGGNRSYFPERVPKTLTFPINESDPNDQYAQLFADEIVTKINSLILPRYGLGNYVNKSAAKAEDKKLLENLSRAGSRLKGFCRTNLFKRLESSGYSFLVSVQRHILRNYVYLYALLNGKPLPIGTQDVGMLDSALNDQDTEFWDADDEDDARAEDATPACDIATEDAFLQQAAEVYTTYILEYHNRFKWLAPELLNTEALINDLRHDTEILLEVLAQAGKWDPQRDAKLEVLVELLTKRHSQEKILVFSQFADTIDYLERELKARGLTALAAVTGATSDPTAIAHRFSPVSNGKRDCIDPKDELRIMLTTDVLSEGQNLQDCAIVVNYDLPWAIIRLIQRAGRVDRIGQQSDTILCYSFLPADGVERIIRLRERVWQRLRENAEVVGADEAFFEGEKNTQALHDLYTEKAGVLDGDEDTEVDLASYAYQIWKNALEKNPALEHEIAALPHVVYATKPHAPTDHQPEGVLVYLRTADGYDALAYIDQNGNSVTESPFAILEAAKCDPKTPALPRAPQHHELVAKGVQLIVETEKSVGGQLGRPSSARYRTYERLKKYAEQVKGTLLDTHELRRAIEEIYRYPLLQSAVDTLNRQLKSGVSDHDLVELVLTLRNEGRLCRIESATRSDEPQIICSLGLREP